VPLNLSGAIKMRIPSFVMSSEVETSLTVVWPFSDQKYPEIPRLSSE
jgi:hypothetical protein